MSKFESKLSGATEDSAFPEVREIFDILIDSGVEYVVCSPGSRNTPLLIAASARQNLKKIIVVDERCAAFVALGLSTVNRKPTALVCTSGTALLNYSPATAEAYYSGIPLIIISADRPSEWIDQDDAQTIRQYDALRNFVKGSFDIITAPLHENFFNKEHLWYVNRITNEAVSKATSAKPGPIHINVRLAPPLNATKPFKRSVPRIVRSSTTDGFISQTEISELATEIIGKKVMIVAGFMPPSESLREIISRFSKLDNIIVLAETLSNIAPHGNGTAPEGSDFRMIDSRLCHIPVDRIDKYRPDIIISFGGALVSRMLKEFLRKCETAEHWSIGFTGTFSDCFMCMTRKIEVNPHTFLLSLFNALTHKKRREINSDREDVCTIGEYKSLWDELTSLSQEKNRVFIKNAPWSDLKAFDIILKKIPEDALLFLSNGTTVRYAQILEYPDAYACYCNRGVSGIDGSTSTAIGGALTYKGVTVLITGDMSFAYDIGALGTGYAPKNFKVIVIRNGGGGIFRFISSTSELPQREDYFCADPNPPIAGLADAYGWNYFVADNEDTLRNTMDPFLQGNNKPSILEIQTPAEISADILKSFFKQ